MKFAIFCCLLSFCFCLAVAENVPCESVDDVFYVSPVGKQKTCLMNETTVIDWPGVLISSNFDESVGALNFYGNKKIKFLPESPAEKFVNLVGYRAYGCSIETITKANFKSLSKLRLLYLASNTIEKVPSDVFEDLTALEVLWLEGNKIKFINSAVFRGLNKLRDVDLRFNVCIKERYENATSVTLMIPTLPKKCGFSEDFFLDDFSRKTFDQVNKISESMSNNRKDQQEQSNTSNALIRETKAEIVKSQDENAKAFANIAAELQDLKSKLAESDNWKAENRRKLEKLQQEQIKNQETIVRQETELTVLREQNQKLNEDLKVNLEKLKTQIQASTNQTAANLNICQQENKDSTGKLAVYENELNAEKTKTKAAVEQLEQKQANNEKLQSTVSDLQIAKAQTEGKVKMLNQQMEQKNLALENVQNENTKHLIEIDLQVKTIASLISLNDNFRNNFEECEREKANIDVDLKIANSNLDVFKGIDIGKFREEIRSKFDSLRNTNTCGAK